MKPVETIAKAPYFNGLDENLLENLAAISLSKNYEAGEIVFAEGDPGLGFHLISKGRVKVFKSAPDGKEQILHIFGPGEPFGEVAIFLGMGYPAWSQALEDTETIFFPRQALRDILALNPELSLRLMGVLSLRLIKFAAMLEAITLKEAPARLAAFIVNLSNEKEGSMEVELTVTKGQLASLLGTAPETISRAMARLKNLELISETKSIITILNMKKLTDMADGLSGE